MPFPLEQRFVDARQEIGCDPARFPESVAIIMDGNGRWAQTRGLPRPLGHKEGAKVVRKIVKEAARLGLKALTLYSFSHQNWSRPADEVNALMHLFAEYLAQERITVMENNVILRHLGSREGLPDIVLNELDETVRLSANNTGMFLCLALNYGSREEIIRAVRKIARRAASGELLPENIDERIMSDSLDTAGVPDPDFIIRTSGEMRLSNYLLWQLSYAEFYVTPAHWPDFDETEFHNALRAYSHRDRRFGGLTHMLPDS